MFGTLLKIPVIRAMFVCEIYLKNTEKFTQIIKIYVFVLISQNAYIIHVYFKIY